MTSANIVFPPTTNYIVYKIDSSFGTAGTPSGSDYLDKVTSFTGNITNNMIRVQGIGDGRNATGAVNGGLDCNGSIEFELTDPSFMQFLFIGELSGAGSTSDPYEIQERNHIGFGASSRVKTITIESGKDFGADDDVMTYDGIAFNTFTVSAELGATVKVTADWIGRTGVSTTTALTYTGPTNRPFTFVDGSLVIGTDTTTKLQSFSITCNNNLHIYRSMGSRFIEMPVAGIRRYDFTATIKMNKDETVSVLSGIDLRGLVFDGTTASVTPTAVAANTTKNLSFRLEEGASSGQRVVRFDLENCYFESISEPVTLEDGAIVVTIIGFGLAGLTDSSEKVPCRYWTIT